MAIEATQNASAHEEPVEIQPAEFVAGGKQLDTITVNINFGIIEQFSEGLYSSPNKTFEELVTNSYDAGATHVWVRVPEALDDPNAVLAVIDNRESMDLGGLRDLWQIGESTRRIRPPARPERNPVGKFGIGKLATYVLANELTYVCKRGDVFLATTMDYRKVKGRLAERGRVLLDVVELTEDEANGTLSDVLGEEEPVPALFGPDAPPNWTAALMSSLKDRGRRLERGRLKWILSVALPLNPQFNLWFNGAPVTSSKAAGKRIWTFTVGTDDLRKKSAYADRASADGVALEHAGLITGTAEMYDLPLPRGKAEELGRSHGFFIKVLERLININDETFGIDVELHQRSWATGERRRTTSRALVSWFSWFGGSRSNGWKKLSGSRSIGIAVMISSRTWKRTHDGVRAYVGHRVTTRYQETEASR